VEDEPDECPCATTHPALDPSPGQIGKGGWGIPTRGIMRSRSVNRLHLFDREIRGGRGVNNTSSRRGDFRSHTSVRFFNTGDDPEADGQTRHNGGSNCETKTCMFAHGSLLVTDWRLNRPAANSCDGHHILAVSVPDVDSRRLIEGLPMGIVEGLVTEADNSTPGVDD